MGVSTGVSDPMNAGRSDMLPGDGDDTATYCGRSSRWGDHNTG
jgi:hypothetical protein